MSMPRLQIRVHAVFPCLRPCCRPILASWSLSWIPPPLY
jgi:hypothetical protein